MARGRKTDETPEEHAIRRVSAILSEAFGGGTIIVPRRRTPETPEDTIEVYPIGHPSATRGEIYDAYVMYYEKEDGSDKQDTE
jgi:hypothetical protein